MGEYTVEQVNRQAQKELRSGAHSQSYGMLKAYAALLERQANAAGEYVANIDRYGGVIWTKGTPPHGTKLFTHPPARASAVPDGEEQLKGTFECPICEGGAPVYPIGPNMKSFDQEEDAKKRRQMMSAQQPKCRCGNCVSLSNSLLGDLRCRACIDGDAAPQPPKVKP